jgi:hypothetical protein
VIEDAGFRHILYGYARSDTRVFLQGRALPDRDAPTFEIPWPSNMTSRDRNHVYYRDAVIPDADPATFEQVSPFYLFRDKRAVYLVGEELAGADPRTARRSQFNSYVIDAGGVYSAVTRARLQRDPATFEELQPFYSKDGSGVYERDVLLPDADPATFRGTSLGRGEDRNYRWQRREIVCRRHAAAPGQQALCSP